MTTRFEDEITELKEIVSEMMDLVLSQVLSSRDAIIGFDKDLAEEIGAKDKNVNAADLAVDKKCEKILALFSPVAIDLRFILANHKITTYLERIGDNAKAMASYVSKISMPYHEEILKKVEFSKMISMVEEMMGDADDAYNNEDSARARKIFAKDKSLNDTNASISGNILSLMEEYPSQKHDLLFLLSIIRKLERCGDLVKNIAEEIIFYIDAKVLKHKNKSKLLKSKK